ncbi:uncharacterized protein RSE6_03316 [Rhynchosporium secalis]|uniref:Uncharacterized protein n=1 Tax=Rhynchosporium secalis TaxID=38038 RepID=A0A1E1M2G4_RHYSE|nr:uncharacterized protein RSE6_03316 [Rhynchosporium secalis]
MLSISRLLTACVVFYALWMLLELIRVKDDELQVDEHISWKDDSRKKTWSEGDFISEAMISAVKDDFKYEYIAEICDQGLWDDSVVFECQNLIGGIVIKLRKEGDLSNLEGGTASMDYFPICHDSVGFADAFGNLLPLRRDIHRLAATALYRLHTIYGVQIDPSVATTSVFADSFIGIHLRTAKDILSYWLGYEDQASYYIQRINASPYLTSLPIVFVASGNATSISDFSALQEDSLVQPKHVLTKHDLLSGDDAVELAGLTWDQQALIDYLILSRSGFFMGMADSSFAWTIAVTRRKETSAGTCAFPKGWWKSKLLGTAIRDDYSDLLGKHGYGWEDKMWP